MCFFVVFKCFFKCLFRWHIFLEGNRGFSKLPGAVLRSSRLWQCSANKTRGPSNLPFFVVGVVWRISCIKHHKTVPYIQRKALQGQTVGSLSHPCRHRVPTCSCKHLQVPVLSTIPTNQAAQCAPAKKHRARCPRALPASGSLGSRWRFSSRHGPMRRIVEQPNWA